MKWLVLLLWDPVMALDFCDAKTGRMDHGKLVAFLMFWGFYVLILLGKLPPLGHTITLCAAGFGALTFRTFLRSKTVTDTETRTVTSAEPSPFDDERGGHA